MLPKLATVNRNFYSIVLKICCVDATANSEMFLVVIAFNQIKSFIILADVIH